MKILKLEENTKVEFIFHFADIHIRLNSRFVEYRYVFEKVYSKLKEYKANGITNAVICIAGDILHSKVDLSPECTMETFNFFSNLSHIFPTIVIGGNHDTLLTNKSRVDSLTSILYERPLSNFFFLKETGVYRYNNLVFFIDSLFDDVQIDMTTNNPMINKIKEEKCIPVTLYHGSVPGWRNTKGFVSKEGDKYISEMNGMVLCLLGDIHLYQSMNDESPKALYSSSLISQNFGETDANHGFICHHLEYNSNDVSLSHEYIRVKNKYRFQDVFVTNSGQTIVTDEKRYQLFDNDEFLKEGVIAEHGNLRVYSEKGMEIESRRVFEYLKKTFSKARWVFNNNLMERTTQESLSTATNTTDTSCDYNVIDSYFQQIQNKFTCDSQMKEAYKYVVRSYQDHFETGNNNIQWKLRTLEFNNLFSYGKNNKVDFRNLDQNTIGIFGPNAYGKSTIIDIITCIFYDKITRMSNSSIAKEIIHVDETKGSAKLVLAIGGTVYEINKAYSRAAKSGKITIKTTLFEIDEKHGNRHELTDEQRIKTNKHIERIIGNYETFCFFNLYLQQREVSFRELSNSKRKSFLYDLYGYAWFESLEKKHKECFKELEIENRVHESKHRELSEWDYNREESNLKKKYQEEKEKVEKEKNEIDLLESQLASLNRSIINFTQANDDQSMSVDKSNILDSVQKKEKNIHSIEKSLAMWNNKFDENLYKKLLVTNYNISDVFSNNKSIQKQQLQDHQTKMTEIDNQSVEQIDSKLQTLQRKVVDQIDSFDSSIISKFPENQLQEIESKLNNLRSKIPAIQTSLKSKYMKLSQDMDNITQQGFKKIKNAIIRQKNESIRSLKELRVKKSEFKEFKKIKESMEPLLPLYRKYESTEGGLFQQYKPNGSVLLTYKKEDWKAYYDTVRCNIEKENSLSEDAILIDQLDSQLSDRQERMIPLRSGTTDDQIINGSKYTKYCSDIQEYESSRSVLFKEDIKLLSNESLLSLIDKLKKVSSTLESQEEYRKSLMDTIEDCSSGFSINKKCDACLNNPFNQKRIKFEKKLDKLGKDISSNTKIYQGYLTKIQDILNPNNYTISCIKDIQTIMDKARHTQKVMNDIQYKREKIQEYENYKQYKILYKQISELKHERLKVVSHQKKMGFYLENLEVLTLLNNIWSFNSIEIVMSFLQTFDQVEGNYEKILSEIDRLEENIEQLTQELEHDIIPRWEQDLQIKEEIESLESDLSFYSDASLWLDEIQKKEKYQKNVSYEQEIQRLTLMKDVLLFNAKHKHLILFLQNMMEIPAYRNSPDDVTIHTVYDDIIKSKTEIDELQKDIQDLKKLYTDVEHNDAILNKIDDIKRTKSRLQLQIESHSNEMTSISMSLAELNLKKSDFNDVVDTLKKNKAKLNLEKIYISIFDKDGLPLFLLQSKMGKVEDKINQMLSPFLGPDKNVRFGLSSDSTKTIEYGFSNKNTKFVSSFVSGAESFLLDIVTKFSLAFYSIRPRSNFFFCDEGLSVLDKTKLSEVDQIFEFFRSTQTNFFIISHISQIRDHVEKVLIVSKENNKSFIDFK